MFIDEPYTFFFEGPERRLYIVHKKTDVMNALPLFSRNCEIGEFSSKGSISSIAVPSPDLEQSIDVLTP